MNPTAVQLQTLIDQFLPLLEAMPDHVLDHKISPPKWSKKEIIGHLIDSAQSNTRRFIVAQYEDKPVINYDQEKWVLASGYQQWDNKELISLWYLVNKKIVHVLNNMPGEMLQRECMTGTLHTLEWLAEDYVKHLLHHMHVVLDLEPVPYP